MTMPMPIFSDQPRADGAAPVRADPPPPVTKEKIGTPVRAKKKGSGRKASSPPAPTPDEVDKIIDTLDPVEAAHQELARRAAIVGELSDDELIAMIGGITPVYSTSEAAEFFGKSNQWLYWGMREKKFIDDDGNVIEPERIGDPKRGRRRFTPEVLRKMLIATYKRGNLSEEEFRLFLRRVQIASVGGEWREREGWKKIHGRWVHPSLCEQDENGKWVRITDFWDYSEPEAESEN